MMRGKLFALIYTLEAISYFNFTVKVIPDFLKSKEEFIN